MSKQSILHLCLVVLAVVLVVVVLIWLIFLGYGVDWAGFREYSDTGGFHPAKTLWDWVSLLIAPVIVGLVLGVSAFLLNRSEQRREAQLADDRQREDRLQKYIDALQDLLEKGLQPPSPQSDTRRDIARVRTLTVLRGLDSRRQNLLFDFLRGTELLFGDNSILRAADLREADLRRSHLTGANLSGADLRGANLSEAYLLEADLRRAKLDGADLSGARLNEVNLKFALLPGADLSGADLGGAKLIAANLTKADLRRANLSGANLSGARLIEADLRRATLTAADLSRVIYDDTTKWPDGFVLVAEGETKVDQEPPDETNTDNSRQV